jgi:soluble epoxide hydrolase/lipid-phosphate phosphatase
MSINNQPATPLLLDIKGVTGRAAIFIISIQQSWFAFCTIHTTPAFTMDPSSYHTVKTNRAYTYSYYISPVKKERGTIVLLHGFPEYADMWADQIKVFENLGYTCIAPDLLGYGGTSKPTDTEAYNSEGQSQDIADIMETVGVQNAIFIGHDWGCYLAGRFAVWQPEKIAGLVLTNVSYRPAAKLDLAVVNRAMVATFGYEVFGFWKWISSADAPKLLGSHVESLFSLLFAKDAEIWQVRTQTVINHV